MVRYFPPPFKYFSESPEKELINVRNYLPDIIESVPFLIISEKSCTETGNEQQVTEQFSRTALCKQFNSIQLLYKADLLHN